MRLFFAGTPGFAVPTLEKLATKHEIELVITNPDEPSGRSYSLKPPPVRVAAEQAGLQVYQPAKLKDSAVREFLSQSQSRPDAMIVVAYGHILPRWMLDLPRLGCLNVHASLLPRYRGAAPIAWAIVRGETVTGITAMQIDAGLDTGDILLQRETAIAADDTTETLSARLSLMGAEVMLETLEKLERGEIRPHPQDHSQATLAPILKKEDGRIHWRMGALEIERRVRGLQPWPGAYTSFRGKNLRLWAVAPCTSPPVADAAPGALSVEGDRLLVDCGCGTRIELREVQLEGRKRLRVRDFLNGVRIAPAEKLGEQ